MIYFPLLLHAFTHTHSRTHARTHARTLALPHTRARAHTPTHRGFVCVFLVLGTEAKLEANTGFKLLTREAAQSNILVVFSLSVSIALCLGLVLYRVAVGSMAQPSELGRRETLLLLIVTVHCSGQHGAAE